MCFFTETCFCLNKTLSMLGNLDENKTFLAFGMWNTTSFVSAILTLRTSEASIPALRKLPCGVARRYTGFVQTSLWHRKPVYRRHGMSTPGVGRRYTGFVLMRTGTRNARVIEIQTTQQLKNNVFHEPQRIFVNKFCIWTSSGQRSS